MLWLLTARWYCYYWYLWCYCSIYCIRLFHHTVSICNISSCISWYIFKKVESINSLFIIKNSQSKWWCYFKRGNKYKIINSWRLFLFHIRFNNRLYYKINTSTASSILKWYLRRFNLYSWKCSCKIVIKIIFIKFSKM